MKRGFCVGAALIVFAVSVQAGGLGKAVNQDAPVRFTDNPASPLDKMEFRHWDATRFGRATAVGNYTGLEGWYDYQNNGGGSQYIRLDSLTGKIHVVYMLSEDSANVSPSRRTGYALSTNDGATWNNFSNVRVPAIRSGFPSMDLLRGPLGPGSPIVTNHNVGGGTDVGTWAYVGDNTGFFTELSPVPLLGTLDGGEPIWPFVVSGANGEVLINSSNTSSLPSDHENYLARTTNLGSTWEPWLTVPVVEGSGGRSPMKTNGGSRIGTVVAGDSVIFWESTDNGSSWQAPQMVYPPTRYTATETLAVWVGIDFTYFGNEPVVALNTSRRSTDSTIFFAGSRIEIWSPSLGYRTAVPWDSLMYPSTMVRQSNHLALGYPQIARSGNNLVIAFQAFLNDPATQDSLAGGRYFSDIFLTQSTDGGNTWALPVNITNTPQMDERYPAISPYNPAGYAYVSWQEDTHSGTYAAATPDEGVPKSLARQVFYKAGLNTLFPVNDITARAVITPVHSNAIRQGSTFAPKATFRNIGLAAQSGVPVRFEILNAAQSVVYTNTQTIPSMALGQTTEVTFATVPGTLTSGDYTTRAIAANPGDLVATNDTVASSLHIIPVITVSGTYTEDFEGVSPETGGFGWYSAVIGPTGTSDWVRGTPAKTQIANAWSGTKCYVTKLAGNYTDGQESFLGSPVFDLSGVTGYVRIEFHQNFVVEPLWDGLWLQYSTDGGTTWNVADHNLASGPTWNTSSSTGWYNAAVDSQIVPGAPAPPMWGDSTVLYVGHVNGWIKSISMLPIGGYSDVRFRFYMSADANQNREGWAIDDFSIRLGPCAVNVPYTAGWNMVSNPVQREAGQDSVLQLYPASVFNYVFGFGTSGYYQTKVMPNGPAYWAKFSSAGSASISGSCLESGSAPVNIGWNIIGSISTSVDTSNVYPSPYGSRASVYFGYSGGYTATASLDPGKAYWVKSSAAGAFLYLPPAAGAPAGKAASNPLAQLNTLTVKDANGNSTTLYFGGVEKGQLDVSMYEMPPVPPAGAFDARFETAEAGYMVQTHEKGALTGEFPVRMQSAVYPVTVSWNIVSDAGYRLMDGVGSKVFAAKELRGTGSMVIRNNGVNRLVVGIGGDAMPTEYALLQNYPNPFNPSTTIKFALPEPSKVTVEIYNLLGQRVNTLVSEQMGAGYHEVKWNGTTSAGQIVGSGIYFARFSASGAEGKTFSDVRKLMLMK